MVPKVIRTGPVHRFLFGLVNKFDGPSESLEDLEILFVAGDLPPTIRMMIISYIGVTTRLEADDRTDAFQRYIEQLVLLRNHPKLDVAGEREILGEMADLWPQMVAREQGICDKIVWMADPEKWSLFAAGHPILDKE